VILLGYEGEKVKAYLGSNHVFGNMEITYLQVPESVWAVRGHAAAVLHAQ
jgi:hypothetical protein